MSSEDYPWLLIRSWEDMLKDPDLKYSSINEGIINIVKKDDIFLSMMEPLCDTIVKAHCDLSYGYVAVDYNIAHWMYSHKFETEEELNQFKQSHPEYFL